MGNDSKSILRVGARSVSKRRAVWDERNLAMNEKIKQELDPSKIDEPKTPYHAPVDPDVGKSSLHINLLSRFAESVAMMSYTEHTMCA
jgi:hypothetical protein